MQTLYDPGNGQFSERCHQLAQALCYPAIFQVPINRLEFESTQITRQEGEEWQDTPAARMDGEQAIDRVVRHKPYGLRHPLQYHIQERFRRAEYFYRFGGSITITEHNKASGLAGELHKIQAGFMLYGFWDESRGECLEWVYLNIQNLLHYLALGEVVWKREYYERKRQYFLSIDLEDLEHLPGVILARGGVAHEARGSGNINVDPTRDIALRGVQTCGAAN